MKKWLLALICAMAFVIPFSVMAETVSYDLTFHENYSYNLDTGVFSATPGWSATNRMTVVEDEITINNAAFVHHILFWDKNNTYIGYGNLSSNYEGSMYLGDFTASITIPAGVARFAFTANNLGVNAPSGLGAYTYVQLFADPLYLDYVYPLFADSLDYVYTTFSINYLDYVDSVGVGTLTLKNLIQNGQFTDNLNLWSAFNVTATNDNNELNAVYSTSVNPQFFTREALQPQINTPLNYYGYFGAYMRPNDYNLFNYLYLGVENYQGYNYTLIHHPLTNNNMLLVSGILKNTTDGELYINLRASLKGNSGAYYGDNVVYFNLGETIIYSKSQIDAAIGLFGYFPYNTAIEVPDVTDADYDAMLLDFTLTDLSTWNGVITGIGTAETLDWLSICDVLVGDCTDVETFFGTPSSAGTYSTEMTYLWQLLLDAQDEVPRWEWYSDKGITSGNYASYLSAYNTILANYSTGITFANFDGLTVSYDREDVVPYVPPTLLEGIEDYIDDFGLGDWAYIFISIAIMIVFAVLLGLMHAPMMVMLIVEGALFLLFTIFGWFPVWLVILVVIILFALLYNLLKGDGQSA